MTTLEQKIHSNKTFADVFDAFLQSTDQRNVRNLRSQTTLFTPIISTKPVTQTILFKMLFLQTPMRNLHTRQLNSFEALQRLKHSHESCNTRDLQYLRVHNARCADLLVCEIAKPCLTQV